MQLQASEVIVHDSNQDASVWGTEGVCADVPASETRRMHGGEAHFQEQALLRVRLGALAGRCLKEGVVEAMRHRDEGPVAGVRARAGRVPSA